MGRDGASEKEVKRSFGRVKDELDDHLASINQNTTEIQSLYELIVLLETKIDKLNEKIDDLTLKSSEMVVEDLSLREQEVFLLIYTADLPLSTEILAEKLKISDELVHEYVMNLIMRGIPILRQYQDGGVVFSLDLRFKDVQAKRKIVRIDEGVAAQLQEENI